jgi:hypothetical protein
VKLQEYVKVKLMSHTMRINRTVSYYFPRQLAWCTQPFVQCRSFYYLTRVHRMRRNKIIQQQHKDTRTHVFEDRHQRYDFYPTHLFFVKSDTEKPRDYYSISIFS